MSAIRILQIGIGAILLLRAATELRLAAYLWGPHGIGTGSTQSLLGFSLGRAVDGVFASELSTDFVVVLLGAAGAALLLGYSTNLAAALALIPMLLLDGRLPELADRGDTVMRLLLLFLQFTLPRGANWEHGSLAVWLHNLAVVAIGFQGIAIYASAGVAKVMGDAWQQGTAMYLIAQIQSLTLPGTSEFFKVSIASAVATYATLLFEIGFPIAIASPLRKPWLVFGVLFHIATAVVLGIITFSGVMIAVLLFYVSDREYAAIATLPRRGLGIPRAPRP